MDPLFINEVKVIKCSSENFLKLEINLLEELTLETQNNETDLQIFGKILRHNNLKFVIFSTNLSDEQIAEIDGKNNSITTLYLRKDMARGEINVQFNE